MCIWACGHTCTLVCYCYLLHGPTFRSVGHWSDDRFEPLSFNSFDILISRNTKDTSFNFIHPTIVPLLTSACEPPSLINSNQKYFFKNRISDIDDKVVYSRRQSYVVVIDEWRRSSFKCTTIKKAPSFPLNTCV